MAKVFLVMEDFEQRIFLGTTLKKVGFDISDVANDHLIRDKIISFGPDIVLVGGNSKKGLPYAIGQKLKEISQLNFKVIYLFAIGQNQLLPQQIDQMRMDAILETPCDVEKFFKVVSHFAGLDADHLIEKFHKAQFSEEVTKHNKGREIFIIKGGAKNESDNSLKIETSSKSDSERVNSYNKFLENLPPPKSKQYPKGSGHTMLKQEQQDLTREEREQIDSQKKSFVKALFSK